MRRRSLDEALRLFRSLADVNAGRVQGRCLRRGTSAPVPTGTLGAEAAAVLKASLYRQPGEPVVDAMVFYVVVCDGTPVAWLTYTAQVVLPLATLSKYQLVQQARASVALSKLTRRAVYELACLRNAREDRYPADAPRATDEGGRVLVADPADPTLTFWTRITPNPDQSLAHVRQLTGASNDVLVVETFGYGNYGRYREVFDIEVLCAIEHLAASHALPTSVVGDWLEGEGAAADSAHPTGAQVLAAFADAYAGVHASRKAFAEAERDRRGYTEALQRAGIRAALFDLDRFAMELFDDQVRDVRMPDYRIAVFRRTLSERPAALGERVDP